MKNPETEQEFLDAAEELVKTAREAAKSGVKKEMRAAADECTEFISNRTLACPKAAVETIAAVQVELSQLIVREDIGSIKARTAQFDAFLQDIVHLSEKAEKAADLISFRSAKEVMDNLTGIVTDLKAIQSQLKSEDPTKVQDQVSDVVDRLKELQERFEMLKG